MRMIRHTPAVAAQPAREAVEARDEKFLIEMSQQDLRLFRAVTGAMCTAGRSYHAADDALASAGVTYEQRLADCEYLTKTTGCNLIRLDFEEFSK